MTVKPKIVLDTTALISAFLTPRGTAAKVLDRTATDCVLVLSEDILAETVRKLPTKTKLRKSYRYSDEDVHEYAEHLSVLAGTLVHDPLPLSGIVRDPEDDMIVACAATVAAAYIVTRDKDLLTLGAYGPTNMVTPHEFLNVLSRR